MEQPRKIADDSHTFHGSSNSDWCEDPWVVEERSAYLRGFYMSA